MSKITHIVVPVDFLKTTDNLVEYATYMAEKLVAILHFVYVIDMYTGDGILEIPYVEECRKRLQTAAEQKMTRLIADHSRPNSPAAPEKYYLVTRLKKLSNTPGKKMET